MPRVFETARRPLSEEVKRRSRNAEFVPGGWYLEGDLLLVTKRTMLSVRATEGAGSHWLDTRDPEPSWSVAVPRIDLANRRIDEVPRGGRAVVARRPRRLARAGRRRRPGRDERQLALPLEEGDGSWAVEERQRAVARFFTALPRRHRLTISPVPPRWQWELLLLFDQGGEAAGDLLESTPALAFGLALAPLLVATSTPPLEEILTWRQTRIAELLGFPASRRSVRALRKLPVDELDAAALLSLQRLLRSEEVLGRISHLPRLSKALLQVARSPESFMALERDSQLALLDPQRGPALAKQLGAMLDRLTRTRSRGYRLPRTIRSSVHAEALARAISALQSEVGPLDAPDSVPPPPFPGIPGVIEPLRSAGDYHEEGLAMRNCVRSRLREAMRGRIALYRVLQPERATLSLERSGPRWRLGDLLAVGNSSVARRTREEVDRWLEIWQEPGRMPTARDGAAAPDGALRVPVREGGDGFEDHRDFAAEDGLAGPREFAGADELEDAEDFAGADELEDAGGFGD